MADVLTKEQRHKNMKNIHGKDTKIEIILRKALQKSNNSAFWVNKISKNRERDDMVNKKLLFMGWTVIRFWGKDIKKHTDECVKVIEEIIFDIKMED